MAITSPLLSVDQLKSFSILDNMAKEQLEFLADSLTVHSAGAGARVIERGTDDEAHYLLLSGQVKLTAADGRSALVNEKSPAAKRPLSQLRPRMYEVVATSNIKYLRIEDEVLHQAQQFSQDGTSSENGDGKLEQLEATILEVEGELCFNLFQDLHADRLVLPSLPDVAVKIRKAVDDEVSDAKRIAAIIQSDPAITAKLLKIANSPIYRGREPFTTCSAAVVRLGITTTHKLVTSFAMAELFKVKSKILQARMREAWEHSIEMGALCFVLGKKLKGFDPEEAMLAGLLHDIGMVAVLTYAEKFPDVSADLEQVELAINALHGQVGAMILRKWGFPEPYVVAALEGDTWHRDPNTPPDYCDLVVAAQLHAWSGDYKDKLVPVVEKSSSYLKLDLGEVTPDHKLVMLEEEVELIREIEAFLGL